jgi:hypothetical protein
LRTFIREEKSEKELQGKIKKNRGVKTQNLASKVINLHGAFNFKLR